MTYEERILRLGIKLLVVGAVVAGVVLWIVQWWLNRVPAQPIAFSHKIHAGDMKISCYYCHTGVLNGELAGVPSVQDCMGCHYVVNSSADPNAVYAGSDADAEINKLLDHWKNQKPVEWNQVYKLTMTVRFPHKAHVQYFLAAAQKDSRLGAIEKSNPAVYPCLICHGDVTRMSRIEPAGKIFYKLWYGDNVNPVTQMGYCVNCHRSYAGKKFAGGPDVPPQRAMIDCTLCHR